MLQLWEIEKHERVLINLMWNLGLINECRLCNAA